MTVKVSLTRDFRQTIVERVRRDPEFAKALLDEAARLFLNGARDAARLVLRDLEGGGGLRGACCQDREARKESSPDALEKRQPDDSSLVPVAAPPLLASSLSPGRGSAAHRLMDNLAAILGVVRKDLGVEMKARAIQAA